MSAHMIMEQAPLGAIIQFSDGTPRPPDRHHKKLSRWLARNSQGRLVRKRGKLERGVIDIPPEFTLHMENIGDRAVTVMRIFRSFTTDTDLSFTIVERPAVGSVLVLDRPGDEAELVYIGSNRQDAEEWLARHGYPRAVLHEVSADEVAADAIEGRAAA